MAEGVRMTAEEAVRSGLEAILFVDRPEAEAAAIDTYLKSLQPVPSPHLVDGRLSPAAERGRQLFHSERIACHRCHPAPLYTDLKSAQRRHADRATNATTGSTRRRWSKSGGPHPTCTTGGTRRSRSCSVDRPARIPPQPARGTHHGGTRRSDRVRAVAVAVQEGNRPVICLAVAPAELARWSGDYALGQQAGAAAPRRARSVEAMIGEGRDQRRIIRSTEQARWGRPAPRGPPT